MSANRLRPTKKTSRKTKKQSIRRLHYKTDLPIIIRDTREKHGFNFRKTDNCGGTIEQKLDSGDYSVMGLENYIVIERKHSMDELCSNLGANRKRFLRDIDRMQHIKYKILLIEDYASSIYNHHFSKMSGSSVLGSLVSLMLKHNIHIIFAGTRKHAQDIARKLLLKAYKYWCEEQEIDEIN